MFSSKVARRSLAAVGAGALVAAVAPFTVAPAFAATGSYTLTGPSTVSVSSQQTYYLSNASLGPAGLPTGSYCLATVSGSGSPGPISATTGQVFEDSPVTSLALKATFPAAGTYQVGVVQGGELGFTCPSSVTSSQALTTEYVTVNGNAAASVQLSPDNASALAGNPSQFSITVLGSAGYPTQLGSNQTITVTSNSPTVTFNGASQTSLLISPGGSLYFTARNSAANQNALITATLRTGSAVTSQTTAHLSTLPSGSMSVAPSVASTPSGGATAFTVSIRNGAGQPSYGIPVSVTVTGRNPLASSVIGSTNANGQVAYTLTDKNPSSSISTDALTFTGGGLTATAKVTYAAQPAPGAPTGVGAAPGDGQATVSWQAPAPNGGPAVTSYTVQYSLNGGGDWSNAPGSPTAGTTLVVTGLPNGTPVTFRVAATNSVGTGSFSVPSAAVTPQQTVVKPGKVVELEAASKNKGKATVSWDAPYAGGQPTGYQYRIKKGNGSYGAWKSLAQSTRTVKFTNLKSGAKYTVQVAAKNSAGAGPAAGVTFKVK